MNSLIEELIKEAPIVTDGAWGTQLQARGLPLGACPDEWNLTQPDKVEEVARSYVEAGSRIILTNTFGANRVRLAEFGLADKSAEINRAGAAISKRATRGSRALVFASIGPTGKMLVAEDVSPEDVYAAYQEQATALKEGGADGIVIETMAELDEIKLALDAAKETGLPVVACMVFDTAGFTMMGVSPEDAATELTNAGADVIGSNCGNGIEAFLSICEKLRSSTSLPVWIKANAGLPEVVGDKVVYKTSAETFASHVPAIVAAGASFIGGCCGTSPDHIRAVCQRR